MPVPTLFMLNLVLSMARLLKTVMCPMWVEMVFFNMAFTQWTLRAKQ